MAGSLHAVAYFLKNHYAADSTDGLDANHYDESDQGLFVCASVSVQPVFDLGKSLSLVPFVGMSVMVIAGRESYQDTVYKRGGVGGKFTSDDAFTGQGRGPELMFGFDLAVRPRFLHGHRVLVGGALTNLYGGQRELLGVAPGVPVSVRILRARRRPAGEIVSPTTSWRRGFVSDRLR